VALDIANIWTAYYTHLTAASTFATLVGGRVYMDNAPARAALPYAVVSFIDKVQVDTFDANGYEIRTQVTMYSAKADGPRAVIDIGDALRDRVHRVKWTPTGHAQMVAVVDVERGPERESELWRYDVDVMLTGFAT
jgi:hypothetical protein